MPKRQKALRNPSQPKLVRSTGKAKQAIKAESAKRKKC